MSGGIFAILAALTFGFNAVVLRRALIKVADATVGVLISVPIGVPFFLLILIAMGQIGSIASFSWQSYAWLSAAGVSHFVLGRSFRYKCVQLVGINITNILTRIAPLVAVTLAISVLGEPLTWQLIVGVLLILFGITIAGSNRQMFRSGQDLISGIPRRALLFGFGAGLFWGLSPILVKMGLNGSGSSVAGVFISYLAATLVLSTFLGNHNTRASLAGMEGRTAGAFCLVGLLSATAQLLRYIALGMAPASVVAPLMSTSPVFQMVCSFLFNRKLEVFSRAVIVGTIAVVAGSILVL